MQKPKAGWNVLSSVGAVVHEEELNVLGVVNEESLVAGGHHVAGLLVGTVTDRGHGHLALEATADGIVNSLRLAPRLTDTLETVRLVTVEAVGAYSGRCQSSDRKLVWPLNLSLFDPKQMPFPTALLHLAINFPEFSLLAFFPMCRRSKGDGILGTGRMGIGNIGTYAS